MANDVGLRGYRVLDPEKTRARRQAILLAMAEVIVEKGYGAATLEDVAARMGASRAVIYYRFRSKEDLYVELLIEAAEIASSRLKAIIARGDPPEVTLHAAVRDLIEIGELPINRSTLRTGRPRNLSAESRARVREYDREYEALMMGIIREGMKTGVFAQRNPRLVVNTLIYASNTSFFWRRPDGPLPPSYFADEIPAMLMNAVLAHPCVVANHTH